MDPILGQIILWPVPWVPEGWALCDGTLIPVNQNQALYSLIGNTYGGSPGSTFALPDLRNMVPMGSQYMNQIGGKQGAATASVNAAGGGTAVIGVNNLPAHTHAATFNPSGGGASVNIAIPVDNTQGTDSVPADNMVLGKPVIGANGVKIYSSGNANTTLKPFSVSVPAGGGTVTNANTGNGQPLPITVQVPVSVSTLQPSLTLNFIICTNGIYPTRP